MNQTNRAKLHEIVRLVKEIISDTGEQLSIDLAPDVADLKNIKYPIRKFLNLLYAEFGMKLIGMGDQKLMKFQIEAGIVRIDKFFEKMLEREIIEVHRKPNVKRNSVASFRIIKAIPND